MACTHRLFFSKQYLTPNARLPDVARLTFTRKRNAGKFSTDTSRYHHKLAIGDRIICKAANSKSVAQRDCWIASGCIEVTADLVELGQSTCSDGQLNTARKHYDIRKLHALSVVTGLSLSLCKLRPAVSFEFKTHIHAEGLLSWLWNVMVFNMSSFQSMALNEGKSMQLMEVCTKSWHFFCPVANPKGSFRAML